MPASPVFRVDCRIFINRKPRQWTPIFIFCQPGCVKMPELQLPGRGLQQVRQCLRVQPQPGQPRPSRSKSSLQGSKEIHI